MKSEKDIRKFLDDIIVVRNTLIKEISRVPYSCFPGECTIPTNHKRVIDELGIQIGLLGWVCER